jgi:hypothetical protein
MTFQQKAVIRALKHSAYALGYVAEGKQDAADLHSKAAQAFADLAVYVQARVANGTPQWLIDSIPFPDDDLSTI